MSSDKNGGAKYFKDMKIASSTCEVSLGYSNTLLE